MMGSRVHEIYRRVRTDILSGRHEPGSKLLTGEMCQRYGISSGVLREVLPRLAGEGLVVSEPQRGFRVAPVSVDDLRQLTEARVLVETTVLRQAISTGDLQYEAELVAAHHTLAGTCAIDDGGAVRDEWLQAHSDFHRALLAGCPNQRLQLIAKQLRDVTEVYRCWAGQLGDERDRDVDTEHRQILEATMARDADLAVTLLAAHYERTMRIMLRVGAGRAAKVAAG
jgi:DNA-binding GntR family transcriptional regulator